MITRQRLLAGLHEATYVEEGMMTLFANFAKALVEHAEGLDEAKKKDMIKLLGVLNRDSTRHKGMVDDLVRKIEGEGKDEY
jgi:hypothetical protein